MIKVGDIIDGRRVTKVFELCGSLAYQSEPVKGNITEDNAKYYPKEPLTADVIADRPKTRGRRKKED